jgi:hypothetical protein
MPAEARRSGSLNLDRYMSENKDLVAVRAVSGELVSAVRGLNFPVNRENTGNFHETGFDGVSVLW